MSECLFLSFATGLVFTASFTEGRTLHAQQGLVTGLTGAVGETLILFSLDLESQVMDLKEAVNISRNKLSG